MDKPFHLLTPQEKTTLRIAQNRVINEKTKGFVAPSKPSRSSKSSRSSVSSTPSVAPHDFVRATPDEHMGSLIRKVKA
jgi:hypothetical protein